MTFRDPQDAESLSASAIGLIDELLVAERNSIRDCKLILWNDLKDLIIPFNQATPDLPELRSAEDSLKAVKGEIYTIIDGAAELFVKKLGQNIGNRAPHASIYRDLAKIKPYCFGELAKLKAKKVE